MPDRGCTCSAPHLHRSRLSPGRWSGWTGTAPPPTFLLHAVDDASVPVENSLNLLAALRVARVATEAHLFQEGGHGFGVRLIAGKPAAVWPQLVMAWAERQGWTGVSPAWAR